MRDPKTEEAKRHINQGVKIKMDDQGNILIKRLCKSNVYIKTTHPEDNAVGAEILRNSQGALEHEKPGKIFDMNKYQTNLSRETRRAYPDRKRLEKQCLSAIVFVRTEPDLLQCPVWVLIVNVVGLDMLKSKLPPSNIFLFFFVFLRRLNLWRPPWVSLKWSLISILPKAFFVKKKKSSRY